MPDETEPQFWEELRDYLSRDRVLTIVFTFANGDKFVVKDPQQIATGKNALSVFLDDGSVLLFQMSNIVCADIKFDE